MRPSSLWAPGWNALEMANVSAVTGPRAGASPGGTATRPGARRWRSALAISSKLYLWPLLVWTAAHAQVRGSLRRSAIGLGVTLAAWAYRVRRLTSLPGPARQDHGRGELFDRRHGGSPRLGPASDASLTALVGGALLGVVVLSGRRGDDSARSLSVAAALVLTPILWQHYLVLLVVPLGLARPRFSALWLLPIVLWVVPGSDQRRRSPAVPPCARRRRARRAALRVRARAAAVAEVPA